MFHHAQSKSPGRLTPGARWIMLINDDQA